MTRKDYIPLAAALRDSKPGIGSHPERFAQFFLVQTLISEALANANPNFDRDRFLAASGS